jgi:uncharacterized protein
MAFRVLAIDGGGIRGIVPAVLLDRLEALAGRPVRELFDLLVGTSTGGLLVLGLAVPDGAGGLRYRADDLLQLYLDDGPRIFSRTAVHRARTANGVLGPRYPAGPVEQVVAEVLGDLPLREVVGDVVVPAYETQIRAPWFFRSRRARTDAAYDFLARDVARATSAAPVYFPPARIAADDGTQWTLIDGGVFANNPAMIGVVEALGAYAADEVVTLSLGTGALTRPLPYEQLRGWGLAKWAPAILDVVFDGVSDTTDFQVTQLGRSTDEVQRHLRLQLDLHPDHQALDDVSAGNLRELETQARHLAERSTPALLQLLPLLAPD